MRALLLSALAVVAVAAPPAPRFHARVASLSPALRARMTGVSWHRAAPSRSGSCAS